MDRHGVLRLLRRVADGMRANRDTKGNKIISHKWRWVPDVMVCPELPCFACNMIVKTNVVMFYDNTRRKMIGQFQVEPGKKVYKGPIYHTHAHGQSGSICMGRAKSLTQLLYSPPYAHGTWEWDVKMVKWYHRYAHHNCPEMEKWWANAFPGYDYPWDGPFKNKRTRAIQLSQWETHGTEHQGKEVLEK